MMLVFITFIKTPIYSQIQTFQGVRSTTTAGGDHAFVGDYKDGLFTNWLNTGLTADAYNLLGNFNEHAGFGIANGNNIVSPIIWMYDYQGRNAFLIKKMPFTGNMTNGSDLFAVRANGNVGIGTITPQNKLSVNGTIWARKVKVSLTDAADWVFEEDYQLRSLEEVEDHITKYRHLPDMPSAEEFRTNDLDVAEMDNKLLQKIEELTLYLIEQNKQNKQLTEEVNELKKKVAELENR